MAISITTTPIYALGYIDISTTKRGKGEEGEQICRSAGLGNGGGADLKRRQETLGMGEPHLSAPISTPTEPGPNRYTALQAGWAGPGPPAAEDPKKEGGNQKRTPEPRPRPAHQAQQHPPGPAPQEGAPAPPSKPDLGLGPASAPPKKRRTNSQARQHANPPERARPTPAQTTANPYTGTSTKHVAARARRGATHPAPRKARLAAPAHRAQTCTGERPPQPQGGSMPGTSEVGERKPQNLSRSRLNREPRTC